MSFSGNILRSVSGIVGAIIASIVAFFVLVLGIPVLEFFFARWVDPLYGARFWVVFLISVIPTVSAGLFLSWKVLLLFWIIIAELTKKWLAGFRGDHHG